MATNFATNIAPNELTARQTRLSFEHRFFLTVAVLFPLITVIGFAPTYYFKAVFNSPPLPSALVHIHGLTMSLWIVLFSVQAILVSSKRIKLHMTLGMLGVVLAVAMIVVGLLTAFAAAARGSAFPGYTPIEFLLVPVIGSIKFAIVFTAAIYYRKNAANHKRLMLLTVLIFLDPSIGRLPFPFILDLGAIWFEGVPDIIAITLLAADTYRNGKLNKAFAAGVALMLICGPIRMLISRTDSWAQFATWILS
jgi:hypothetical protein